MFSIHCGNTQLQLLWFSQSSSSVMVRIRNHIDPEMYDFTTSWGLGKCEEVKIASTMLNASSIEGMKGCIEESLGMT